MTAADSRVGRRVRKDGLQDARPGSGAGRAGHPDSKSGEPIPFRSPRQTAARPAEDLVRPTPPVNSRRGRHAAPRRDGESVSFRGPGNAPPAAARAVQAKTTLWFSAAFVLSLSLVAAGYLAHIGPMRLAGVLAAAFFGVGAAPLQLSGRGGLVTRLGVAGLIGLSTLFLGGTVMALVSGWHPARAAVVIGLIAAVAHVAGCVRAVRALRSPDLVRSRAAFRRTARGRNGGWRTALNLSAACTAAGTALWCYGAVKIGHITPGVAGFLPKISVLWFAGLILLLAAISLARHKTEAHAMSALLSLVVAVTLTPALAYGMPRAQSAAKHVDLVQWILSVHYLDPAAGIYQTFSGFFSGIAWVCDVAHFSNVMAIATYWPLIIGLIGFAELRFFLGRLNSSSYRICVGMTFVVLVNAIGADYFSPSRSAS